MLLEDGPAGEITWTWHRSNYQADYGVARGFLELTQDYNESYQRA